MQIFNEQHEEEPNTNTTAQNMQKMGLIDASVAKFSSLVRTSLVVAVVRIVIFFLIFINEETFLCPSRNANSDSWSVIFYILASLMDFLVVLNDAQILRFLKKQCIALTEIKQQLSINSPNIPNTALGPYTTYLNISTVIQAYKFRAHSTTSISQTVRYMQAIITFYTFGNLAVDSQYKNNAPFFQCAILWTFILSIYFSVFELDLLTIEASSGAYMWPKTVAEGGDGESIEFARVKDNYIRRIRRPFELVYLINILLLLAIVVLYPTPTLLTSAIAFVIATHMGELILEKHTQNRLISVNLGSVPKQYLTPALIRYELSKHNSTIHAVITTVNRLAIVLMIMACFRSPQLELVEFFLLFLANVLLFLGQKVKLRYLQRGKLYVLESRRQERSGGQCSICLLGYEKGQKVLSLPCYVNHVYHLSCLRNWLRQRRQCPLCRHSLQQYDIIE